MRYAQPAYQSRRIEFELERIQGELEETSQLVADLEN
jgi:Ni,Fe-hydrogenase III large subunit